MQIQAMRQHPLCKNKQYTSDARASKACARKVHVGNALASNVALRRAKDSASRPARVGGVLVLAQPGEHARLRRSPQRVGAVHGSKMSPVVIDRDVARDVTRGA